MPREDTLPRMGWFLKTPDGLEEEVRFSSRVVTQDILTGWAPRANYISVIEMLGALSAIEWLDLKCRGKRITLLVDSESIPSAWRRKSKQVET